jgi:phosphopantetheine--protein transferase-like protein
MQRIRNISATPDDPFFLNSFSEKEKEESSGHKDPVIFYSVCFAGKEAVIKSIGIDESIMLSEIEILGNGAGRPIAVLTGTVKKMAEKKEIKNVTISLSHDGDYAIAFAIAEY